MVDVTNYVMLELGQPLHAYDDAHARGRSRRRASPQAGETLTLLNGQTLELDPDLLLVADEKKPLGLAGIMGGEHSGINGTPRRASSSKARSGIPPSSRARRAASASPPTPDFASSAASISRNAPIARSIARRS